jgi:hypothetical protein
MQFYRWIWAILTFSTLAWYSTVTVYVAIRGVRDIREMLANLRSGDFDPDQPDTN